MRYYKIRAENVRVTGTPKEGLVAVSLREAESRLSEEIKEAHGYDKAEAIIKRVREHSITINKDYAKKTVFAHNVPLIYKDIFREMFPEYTVSFQP